MGIDENKLKMVWEESNKTAIKSTQLPKINFKDIISALVSLGPFYIYVVDFYDMSLSHISPSIKDIQGFEPETVTFDDIISSIHPEDMDFVAQAEATNLDFIYNTIGKEKILNYKTSYSFRCKMHDGTYQMINHQAIVLTIDENGGFGKSLNIHTKIDHITKTNTNQISLIGLNGFPSFMNIEKSPNFGSYIKYTKREIEIIKCIYEGCSNINIGEKLYISVGTVKKHRNNISKKSGCKNSVELINQSLYQGLL